MAAAAQHRALAEEFLDLAAEALTAGSPENHDRLIARAQVHATLAGAPDAPKPEHPHRYTYGGPE